MRLLSLTAAVAATTLMAGTAMAATNVSMWYHGAGNEVESNIINQIISDFNSSQSDYNVVHGLRHSRRDRLRTVECPSDIIDAIGGWTTTGIGHAYSNGYGVDVMAKWMTKIEC